MAVEQQLNKLRKSVNKWNIWRSKHLDREIDLSDADLSGTDLSGADLSGVNLSRANLSRTNLDGANLSPHVYTDDFENLINLDNANIVHTDLSGANLRGAKLSNADLNSANLSDADLSGASLSEANLSSTFLNDAILINANFWRVDFTNANLSGANFCGADLSSAIFISNDFEENATLNAAKVGWTVFGNLDLREMKGLETICHNGPSIIGVDTLFRSHGDIPATFLRQAGLDESFIEYVWTLTNKPIEYYTCFISYSSKDELFARQLHNDLKQEGVHCWCAAEDMNIGDKIKHRIDESIRSYDKLLLILSEHSIASSWVEYEVGRALDKEPHGIPNVLYPVRVDQTVMTCRAEWAREIKNTRHIGDFEHWTDPQEYEKNFKRLLRALNTKKEQGKI